MAKHIAHFDKYLKKECVLFFSYNVFIDEITDQGPEN